MLRCVIVFLYLRYSWKINHKILTLVFLECEMPFYAILILKKIFQLDKDLNLHNSEAVPSINLLVHNLTSHIGRRVIIIII